jgi:hypothetical protein
VASGCLAWEAAQSFARSPCLGLGSCAAARAPTAACSTSVNVHHMPALTPLGAFLSLLDRSCEAAAVLYHIGCPDVSIHVCLAHHRLRRDWLARKHSLSLPHPVHGFICHRLPWGLIGEGNAHRLAIQIQRDRWTCPHLEIDIEICTTMTNVVTATTRHRESGPQQILAKHIEMAGVRSTLMMAQAVMSQAPTRELSTRGA